MVYSILYGLGMNELNSMEHDNKAELDSIRSYYDHNTPRFLSYGDQRKTRTIHRPVWGEGVQNGKHALHYVHELILGDLNPNQNETIRHLNILDMGCGVGASLFYIKERLGKEFTGIGLSISPVQVRIAQQEQLLKDPGNLLIFLLGDFLAPPINMQFDLVFAIESFAHTADPKGFFRAVARLLKPGGKLVLCDDFRSDDGEGESLDSQNDQWLSIFKEGWGVKGIWQQNYVQTLAESENLLCIKSDNLTPYLRLKPIPGGVVELLSVGLGIIPGKKLYWQSVLGGQALQLCLAHGIVEYRYLVFEKKIR